ncbi:MAG: DUF359 domain-containing protein [Nitrososphaerales archaeon]
MNSKSAIYHLPERLRVELKKPWGQLIPNAKISKQKLLEVATKSKLRVAVGDATSENLSNLTIHPDIYVVDGKEKRILRQPPKLEAKNILRVENPAGCITGEAIEAVLKAITLEKPVGILVEGEEDLLALVFFATYPDGTTLFYGQPNEGMVIAKVETCREKAVCLLKLMGVPSSYLSMVL